MFGRPLRWGLKATLCNLRTFVYNCALLWPFGPLSKGNFRSPNDDNRRQSWTIVDEFLKPPFAKPPFRLSRNTPRHKTNTCRKKIRGELNWGPKKFGNGPNAVSGSTVSNTDLSEFIGAH